MKTSVTTIPQRTVVLVGMMGVGKTTIGEKLASDYGLPFFDSDRELEKRTGTSTKAFFAQNGEAYFREQESLVIRDLLRLPPHILAIGGGGFTNDQTREAVKMNAISLWLHASVEVNFERAQHRKDRSIMQHPNAWKEFQTLYLQRQEFYRQADIELGCDPSPDEVITRAAARIDKYRIAHMST